MNGTLNTIHQIARRFIRGTKYKTEVIEKNIEKIYYMAARGYEISLRVLKYISQLSAANESSIFQQARRRETARAALVRAIYRP